MNEFKLIFGIQGDALMRGEIEFEARDHAHAREVGNALIDLLCKVLPDGRPPGEFFFSGGPLQIDGNKVNARIVQRVMVPKWVQA